MAPLAAACPDSRRAADLMSDDGGLGPGPGLLFPEPLSL